MTSISEPTFCSALKSDKKPCTKLAIITGFCVLHYKKHVALTLASTLGPNGPTNSSLRTSLAPSQGETKLSDQDRIASWVKSSKISHIRDYFLRGLNQNERVDLYGFETKEAIAPFHKQTADSLPVYCLKLGKQFRKTGKLLCTLRRVERLGQKNSGLRSKCERCLQSRNVSHWIKIRVRPEEDRRTKQMVGILSELPDDLVSMMASYSRSTDWKKLCHDCLAHAISETIVFTDSIQIEAVDHLLVQLRDDSVVKVIRAPKSVSGGGVIFDDPTDVYGGYESESSNETRS